MKRFGITLLILAACAGASTAGAQVVPSATRSQMSVTAGALMSAFQPDYGGGGVADTAPNRLYGAGAYVDVRLSRWIQIEAEGRWLRFNKFVDIYQDNYLIGPRLPIHQFGRITPYGKFLFGIGHMNFEYSATSCRCTDLVYGGGADVQLTKRITWRAVDFEYQQWPTWYAIQNGQLHPYGFSTGIGYKIF